MKSLIVLLISAFILTGCGGSGAKIFSKFFIKNSTKTFASTNRSAFQSTDFIRGPVRAPSLWRCASQKVINKSQGRLDKRCNDSS